MHLEKVICGVRLLKQRAIEGGGNNRCGSEFAFDWLTNSSTVSDVEEETKLWEKLQRGLHTSMGEIKKGFLEEAPEWALKDKEDLINEAKGGR